MRGKSVLLTIMTLAAVLCADTVYLKNGQTYTNCRARFRQDGMVEVKTEGGTLVLPREKVAYIEYSDVEDEEVSGESEPVLSPVLKKILSGKKETEDARRREGEDKSRLQVRVEALISLIATGTEEDRQAAKEGLTQMGRDALPFILKNLNHENGYARNMLSEILSRMAPKTAIKQILETLYAISPENADLPHHLKVFAINLRDALRNATGRDFGYWPNSIRQVKALDQWIKWYEENMLELPPQVGEPELDPEAVDYKEKVKELRKLELKKTGLAARLQPEDQQDSGRQTGGEQEETQ